jgi:hypothetical protein
VCGRGEPGLGLGHHWEPRGCAGSTGNVAAAGRAWPVRGTGQYRAGRTCDGVDHQDRGHGGDVVGAHQRLRRGRGVVGLGDGCRVGAGAEGEAAGGAGSGPGGAGAAHAVAGGGADGAEPCKGPRGWTTGGRPPRGRRVAFGAPHLPEHKHAGEHVLHELLAPRVAVEAVGRELAVALQVEQQPAALPLGCGARRVGRGAGVGGLHAWARGGARAARLGSRWPPRRVERGARGRTRAC